MATTIADIAKEAGVSISTVSRVINNTKPVNQDLRDKVYAVIKKNNFKPNTLARGLVTKRTNLIGAIVPDISNAVFGALLKGINNACSDKEYTIMVCESGGKRESELKLLEILEERQIDGVLYAGIDVDQELVDVMKTKDYPVVLVTQECSVGDGILHTVVHDNVAAVNDATEFLINNGHERIAYIGGPKHDFSSGKKRLRGYTEALQRHNIELTDTYIEQGEFSLQHGYSSMKKIYEENTQLPTAVLAGNDVMAIGAIQFLLSVNVKVPEEISVIGFDDLEIAEYFQPRLSTVRISYFNEGVKAGEVLMDLIENKEKEPMTHYVGHKIIRRNTVQRIK